MARISDAASLARRLVAPLGQRWSHVQAVALQAEEYSSAVASADRATLVAAAWLHDIGYAPEIAHTGFHPLDGGRYLAESGWPAEVVSLVAHHSGARFEAVERGLSAELRTFPFQEDELSDALAAADLTTGPGGQHVSFDERVDEILARYAPVHPVHRAWLIARPVLAGAVERTAARVARSQSTTG